MTMAEDARAIAKELTLCMMGKQKLGGRTVDQVGLKAGYLFRVIYTEVHRAIVEIEGDKARE